jgi:hypothetical protein
VANTPMKLSCKLGSQGEGEGSRINGGLEQTPVVDTSLIAQVFSLTRYYKMISKSKLLPLLVLSLGTSCVGHDGHDKDQMPLDYVRFPYQATYPGDDSGQSVLPSSRAYTCAQFF